MSQDQASSSIEPECEPGSPTIKDVGVDYSHSSNLDQDFEAALDAAELKFRENLHQDPLIGTILDGKYHVLEVLGFGGMSVVYKARQEPVDRLVAIKTVKFRADERPDIWRRFEREVRTLSKLSHPNVVTVYDCVIGDNGQPYVVMDYLKGMGLDQALLNGGRMSLARVYSVASQVCLGVAHAHRHQVIHRDIKPANIMLLDSSISGSCSVEGEVYEQVKVVDFGLAKLGEDSRRLTHSGELWGSPPYMSPEQICGRECDGRADIYSLACVIYEMLTGQDPFWGANVYELLHCHMHDRPKPLSQACPEGDFPLQLENVIARAMAKDPADRYETMIDFKDALEEACLRPSGARAITAFELPPEPAAVSRNQPPGKVANSASHVLAIGLSLLLVAACILFTVNMAHKMDGTKVTRVVPPKYLEPLPTVSSARPSKSAVSLSNSAKSPLKLNQTIVKRRVTGAGRDSRKFQVRSLSSGKTMKNSAPNSSTLTVDQSKFDMLRRLKSPLLRNEAEVD